MLKICLTCLITFFYFAFLNAQTDTPSVNIDTIYDYEELDLIIINAKMDKDQIAAYLKLKYNVKKTMPYAKLSAYKLRAMEDHLSTLTSKKEKKKYIKACEANLKALFKENLKNLTIDQGKVLMKLLHRETGNTTWELMKKYRGGLEALLWQSFGSVYGHDLKVEYDPALDYQIEYIIKQENLE